MVGPNGRRKRRAARIARAPHQDGDAGRDVLHDDGDVADVGELVEVERGAERNATSTETQTMAMTGVSKRAERRSRMRGRNASCAKLST